MISIFESQSIKIVQFSACKSNVQNELNVIHLIFFTVLLIIKTVVLILDGNSENGAHVRNNLCYLICLRYLIRSRAVTNLVFPKRPIFLDACATFYESPSNLNTTIKTV